MVKNILTNILNGALILMAIIIVVSGIYTYGNSSLSGYVVDGTQSSSANITVMMDSNNNININDAYLESTNSYLSEEVQNLSNEVTNNIISCSWVGWSKSIPSNNCTCILLGKKISCGDSYNNISCTCIQHTGRMYYCSSNKITEVKDYWYKDSCKDYIFNVNNAGESPSVGVNIGPTEGDYPGNAPDFYGFEGMPGLS